MAMWKIYLSLENLKVLIDHATILYASNKAVEHTQVHVQYDTLLRKKVLFGF